MANYYKIKKLDIANGIGIRTSIFFSGCPFKCKGCHNEILWDKNVGKEFTDNTIEEIAKTMNQHILGLSVLGGEPLCEDNIESVLYLCKRFKETCPEKSIWLWTGYKIENIKNKEILKYIDVLIDGQFIQEEYDPNLDWRGSRNQRILYKGKDF